MWGGHQSAGGGGKKGGEKGGPASYRQLFKERLKIWAGGRAERLRDQGYVLLWNNMEGRQAIAGFR